MFNYDQIPTILLNGTGNNKLNKNMTGNNK